MESVSEEYRQVECNEMFWCFWFERYEMQQGNDNQANKVRKCN